MESLLAESTALFSTPLPQEEGQYDELARSLLSKLNKLSTVDLASARESLDAITPSEHTLLYSYIVIASIEASAASGKAAPRQLPPSALPEGALWPYITQLLLEFDPIQARYSGGRLHRVIDYVAVGAEQSGNYVPAIQLLHHVILRLDSSSSTLTSTHRTFVRLCLLSQAYADALQILDKPIYHIPPAQLDNRIIKYRCSHPDQPYLFLRPATGLSQQITTRIYLEYYLLGAMCYMALRRYKEAMFFLEVVLSAPAAQNAASSLMVEAYKKWSILGLLMRGTPPPLPRAIGPNAIKHVRALSKPYDCVTDAFKAGNIEQLRSEMEAGNAVWQEDGNYGLMVEVFQAFRKFAVLKLARTFAALPLTEVARRTSPDPTKLDETQTYLQRLIADGALNAVITDGTGGQTLRFQSSSASAKSEAQVESALAIQTQELQILLKHVQDTEHRMEGTREYVDYLKKLKKVKDEDKKTVPSSGGQKAVVNDTADEDMMEDY